MVVLLSENRGGGRGALLEAGAALLGWERKGWGFPAAICPTEAGVRSRRRARHPQRGEAEVLVGARAAAHGQVAVGERSSAAGAWVPTEETGT